MDILLDTNIFLWIISDDKRLTQDAIDVYLDPKNRFLLSMASVWEMFIKVANGKLSVPKPPAPFLQDQIQENSLTLLPIRYAHTAHLIKLADHHKDPFDRLIICQALVEKMPVLSSDKIFAKYGVENLFIREV